MKHSLRYLTMLLAFVLVGVGSSSCSTDDTDNASSKPSLKVSLGAVGPNSAELLLATNAIAEYAYKCFPADKAEELTPAALFATGTTGTCKNGTNTITVSDLESQSNYVVYLAAKTTKGTFYDGALAPVSFTTTDYTDEITIIKRTPDGFVVHIELPKEVIDRGNVIKWGMGNILLYNSTKMGGSPDTDFVDSNDEYYHKYFNESTTLIFDEEHMIAKDENGQPIYDGEDPRLLWDFVAPGEPLVLILGEHEYGESMWGWGMGWYKAMFDFDRYYEENDGGVGPLMPTRTDENSEAKYWSGYYKKIEVRSQEPEVLDAKVKLETADLRPNGGLLRFNPEEGVKQYCVGIFDQATLNTVMMPLINNDESLLQWFVSSYTAIFIAGTQTYTGPAEIDLAEFFYTVSPGVPYHVIITALGGDELGSKQSFTHEIIELPDPTMPAPVVQVKGIDNPEGPNSPYEVWFNIKAPNGDLDEVMYACDYVRNFEIALDNMATYASLIEQNAANAFSASQVAQINSADGLNVQFPSRENSVTRLAVMGENIEGTANNPDEIDSPAVADNRTIHLPDAPRVESSLFTDLLGDWTATATVKWWKYNENTWGYEWVDVVEPLKAKVTIASGVTYPATLPQEVYDGPYAGVPKEEVDGYFKDLKENADIFNSKTRGQNRLLCMGYGFVVDPQSHAMDLASPYDLFINPNYNSDIAGLFYDFGPKWYMQVAADGSVFVPVNMNRLTPMTAWASGDEYHLAPSDESIGWYTPTADADPDDINNWPNIPVSVSADKRTITLKSKTVTTDDNVQHTLFPTPIYLSYGMVTMYETRVVSEVVLTKGWSGTAATSSKVHSSKNKSVPGMSSVLGRTLKPAANGVFRPQTRPTSRTSLSTAAPVQYERVKGVHAVTPDQVKANIANYQELVKKGNARK